MATKMTFWAVVGIITSNVCRRLLFVKMPKLVSYKSSHLARNISIVFELENLAGVIID
jgi:hypothetical protein